MQYRQLGRTDLRVSRICFGCWQLSPRFWGEVPVEPWEAALRTALDAGINFVDTADAYGNGHAEDCLGAVFAREPGTRDRVVLATKFYWNFESGQGAFPDTRHDYILRACEASLKRLRTDRIDLYQIHAHDPLTRPEDVAAALLRLRREGKVRWFGVSNLNPEQMRLYARWFPVDCLQPPYSLLAREVESETLPYCLAEGMGVIVYSPLYRGLLSGKHPPGHVFSDTRGLDPLCRGAALARIQAGLEELRPVAASLGLTLPQLAVRWVLRHPAVTCAISGIKTPEHVTGIVKAADEALPAEVWHQAAGILARARKEALAAGA